MEENQRDKIFNKMGFDKYVTSEKELSDKMLVANLLDYFPKSSQKSFNFIMLSTNHKQQKLNDEKLSLEIMDEDINTDFARSLTQIQYQDEAIGNLIKELKNKNLYNNSIIIIYAAKSGLDHNDKVVKNRMKHCFDLDYQEKEMMNTPLFIHIPGTGISERITTVGGQTDFLPTICNLMDLTHSNSYMIGQDILNTYEGYSAFISFGVAGSFVKDGVILQVPRSGGFEGAVAYSLESHSKLNVDQYEKDYLRSVDLVDIVESILSKNLYKE